MVTWEDIAEAGQKELRKQKIPKRYETGLAAETLRKRMRSDELGNGKGPAPEHAARTDDREHAVDWASHPAKVWQERATYVDNKRFVMARTAAQRKRMRQARVTYHLRKPSERTEPGYFAPMKKHTFTGIPSVEVTAAVAVDRIIMWHVVPKP